MGEVIRQTLDLLSRLLLPAIYFADLRDQHVVRGFVRLLRHIRGPR